MKLLNTQQIREWDAHTIKNEPVTSEVLMERAAGKAFRAIVNRFGYNREFIVMAGNGNNGGDGLVIARKMIQAGICCRTFIRDGKRSPENQKNLEALQEMGADLFSNDRQIFQSKDSVVIIDALFGTGLNRNLSGYWGELMLKLNKLHHAKVAIDIPSGMPADVDFAEQALWPVLKANHTFTFQLPKQSFQLLPFAEDVGRVELLDIKLDNEYLVKVKTNYHLINNTLCKSLLKNRERFSHKGNYGHAILIGGHSGSYGAIALSALASVKTGAGLTSILTSSEGLQVVQSLIPEAMAVFSGESHIKEIAIQADKYNAIGIGPGMGSYSETKSALIKFLTSGSNNFVLDADALNLIASDDPTVIPKQSIITPHPKEFDRLFGPAANPAERFLKQKKTAIDLEIYIVLKGAITSIASPAGNIYFNTSGNAALAKGGSGDCLTGIITALLAKGYKPEEAAVVGVYLHGLAADMAVKVKGEQESLSSTELCNCIGRAYAALLELPD